MFGPLQDWDGQDVLVSIGQKLRPRENKRRGRGDSGAGLREVSSGYWEGSPC